MNDWMNFYLPSGILSIGPLQLKVKWYKIRHFEEQ